jgi:hypothetical protein
VGCAIAICSLCLGGGPARSAADDDTGGMTHEWRAHRIRRFAREANG